MSALLLCSALSIQDAHKELNSDQLTLRRFGYPTRSIMSLKMVDGSPVCFRSFLDENSRFHVDSPDPLPSHLSFPVTRLEKCRNGWIDRLMLTTEQRRRSNILRAIYVVDRLIARLFRRAIKCRGTRYLKNNVANVIISAAQQVATASFEVDGTAEEAAFEEAWSTIVSRLDVAECPLAA